MDRGEEARKMDFEEKLTHFFILIMEKLSFKVAKGVLSHYPIAG